MTCAQEDEGEDAYASFNQTAFEADAMLLLAAGGSSKTEIRALQGQEVLDYTNKVVKDRGITAAKVKEVYDREGAFDIPDMNTDGVPCVQKGPYRLSSGAIYIGQWQEDLEKRAGKGR